MSRRIGEEKNGDTGRKPELYGYVRVSSQNQNEQRQLIAMEGLNIPEKNMYVEKVSGKNFKRPKYQKLLKQLKKGDVLVVKSIDRLGRNYEAILEQWRMLTKQIGVQIVVLDMPLLDTRGSKDLTGILITDIVLQLLSYVAQCERENIKERQAEGIAAAKRRGVKFGRPEKRVQQNHLEQIGLLWRNGRISASEAGRQLGISRQTFLRRMKDDCSNN